MESVVLVIHLFLALAIIGLVLLQRSEGGGLGIGGGSGGGLGNFASAQGTANALTKVTAICAGLFFCTSLFLGILAGQNSDGGKGILEQYSDGEPAIEDVLDAMPSAPSQDALQPPTVPLSE